MLSIVGQLIEGAGGVQGLVAMLQPHGLAGAAQSWVGTGANESVSGAQLGQELQGGGLGATLQETAGKLGLDQSWLPGQFSEVLPGTVDQLTPDGQLPAQGAGFHPGMLEASKLFSWRAVRVQA